MFTPDELLLIRDLLALNRKEKKSVAAKTVITTVIEKTDRMIRTTIERKAA